MEEEIKLTTELRHLSSTHRRCLAEILDIGDNWKTLAAAIKKPDTVDELLFNTKNVYLLEQQKLATANSPTQCLLDYWGTYGRKRATISDLLNYLIECKLYCAADYVSIKILNGQSIGDQLNKTEIFSINNQLESNNKNVNSLLIMNPTAPNLSSISIEENHLSEQLTCLTMEHTDLKRYELNDLITGTNNFDEKPIKQGGHKIGEGAFGSVFLIKKSEDNQLINVNSENNFINSLPCSLAVKKLKENLCKQFLNEISTLSNFKHENILPLLGYSFDGTTLCLVFEYMCNGSLYDRLFNYEDETNTIEWKQRLLITKQIANGICYLHTFANKPFIHRDIKSANILLDIDMTAKLGDFGLVRMGSISNTSTNTSGGSSSTNNSRHSRSIIRTNNVIGTSVYMAPEAFRGDISVKLDTFSFGIVMLELLTGLMPYDTNRLETDLLSYVDEVIIGECEEDEENLNENHIIGHVDGHWDLKLAVKYFKIARLATEERKRLRPTMLQLRDQLANLTY